MNYLHQIIAFLNDAEELELDKQPPAGMKTNSRDCFHEL